MGINRGKKREHKTKGDGIASTVINTIKNAENSREEDILYLDPVSVVSARQICLFFRV